MSFTPDEHETLFELVPIGVNYRCELCGEGNMIVDASEPVFVEMTNPPKMSLRTHICDKCNGSLKLPKAYPYVEWVSTSEYAHFVASGIIKQEGNQHE